MILVQFLLFYGAVLYLLSGSMWAGLGLRGPLGAVLSMDATTSLAPDGEHM